MRPPKFTQEQRDAAVDRYLTSDLSADQVAKEVGCSRRSLMRWVAERRGQKGTKR